MDGFLLRECKLYFTRAQVINEAFIIKVPGAY